MKVPLVSVVIPAYNAEKTIRQTVESVIGQTFTEWEMIVVNDCSRDGTLAILEEMAAEDSRIRVVTNEQNGGVSYSRNCGVQEARGDWIAFLDSDDVWRPDKQEKQMLAQKKTEADIFCVGFDYMDGEGNPLTGVFHVPMSITYKGLLKKNVVSTSGIMIRRDWMLRYPFRTDVAHEDLFEWLTLLKAGAVAVGIDEPLHTLRIFQKDSRSGNKLRSAINRMRLYQQIGISLPAACWYWICYVWNALNKYGGIRSK